MNALLDLEAAPTGVPLTLAAIQLPKTCSSRLAILGIREGASICVFSRTNGNGRILGVSGSRIAVGREVVEAMRVVQPA